MIAEERWLDGMKTQVGGKVAHELQSWLGNCCRLWVLLPFEKKIMLEDFCGDLVLGHGPFCIDCKRIRLSGLSQDIAERTLAQ